jgi:hypothetical protein
MHYCGSWYIDISITDPTVMLKMFDMAPSQPAMLVMGVTAFASSILRSVRLFLIEQALCRAYFEAVDPKMIRPDGSVEERRCKSNEIQANVALVSGLFEMVTLASGKSTMIYMNLADV